MVSEYAWTVVSEYEVIPAILQTLEKEYGNAWNDTETIESSSKIIDESKFCGKRNYLDIVHIDMVHTG